MKAVDIIVLVILAIWFVLALFFIIRRKKRGIFCCGSCADCRNCSLGKGSCGKCAGCKNHNFVSSNDCTSTRNGNMKKPTRDRGEGENRLKK
ncbi:MAG: FeoB-associated Cys-rich membrane protein [Eubacteriales bacterium]|nr:FeoB-associated Cys-rich membrane protein [Eubacteriales bacterium]